jgi:predicted aldo/keto reductase-like oxidoreductase
MDRREFLRRSALAGIGAGMAALPLDAARAAEPPGVRRRLTLGRTGLQVPDIGFGSSRLAGDEALVLHALERGITYFDTAEGYKGGESEKTLGRALRGRRDEAVLVTKVQTGPRAKRGEFMAALEGSLQRLQTDRVEIYLNHAVNDVDRLKNPEWGEFVELAKQQGKIRFSGMSGHGGRLVECLDTVADRDLADVVLVGYNYGQDPAFFQRFTASLDFVAVQPDLPRVLARLKEKKVGVVAMKTLRGARLNDLRPYEEGGATFAQAAFRWVLSSPHVDSLVVTMKSPEMIDEYLGASGWESPGRVDLRLLERYQALNGSTQCRYGCGDCADACPSSVEIAEVLRTRMYARDYGDLELACGDYASLGRGAAACLDCARTPCAGACPHGLDIPALTAQTHRQLG